MFFAWSYHSTNKIKHVLVLDWIILKIKYNRVGAWSNHSTNKICFGTWSNHSKNKI